MNYFFITGSSKGIGKAITELLLEDDDNHVVGIARSAAISHDRYTHVSLDLSDADTVSSIEFDPIQEADRIVLLNNAGALGTVDHYGKLTDEMITHTLNLNLLTPALLMNKFIAAYQDVVAEKVIINVTSGAAQSAYDGWANYCTAKAGLDMLTRVVAQEQELSDSSYPFTVLAVAPGVVDTQMQTQIRSVDVAGFSRKQKFIDLKEQQALYDASAVAQKYLDIMFNPGLAEDVISRISL